MNQVRQSAAATPRVKVCGVTTPADGLLAAAAGADAVGLNFYAPSPRAVAPRLAAEIAAALPPFVTTVAVFVDPPAHLVEEVLDIVRPHLLQFHGSEPAAFCRQFRRPYIKAAAIGEGFDFDAFATPYADAQALLFDTFDVKLKGGTGRAFDWSRWPGNDRQPASNQRSCRARPLILAGGLRPENVARAVAATRPYAVDVASGVEGAVKGRKDADRLRQFMAALASAGNQ